MKNFDYRIWKKMGRMVEELAQQKGWEILAALDGQDAKLLRQLKKSGCGG